MSGYENIKRKIIVVCQKYTHGELLVDLIASSGVTEIPEPHTPKFFDFIHGSEYLKKLKDEEYVENFREAIAANSDLEGFVTIVSKSFFNIARERMGRKDKSEAMDAWLDIFGESARFIFLDVRNFAYRAIVKKSQDLGELPSILKEKLLDGDLELIYKTHIRKDDQNWALNKFDDSRILKVDLEDLMDRDNEEVWIDIKDHIDLILAKNQLDIDLGEHDRQYRIAKESLVSLEKLRRA